MKYKTHIIVIGTIITGALNSVLTKYQDMQCVAFCDDPSKAEYFDKPILQTLQMFVGELFCWIPVYIIRYRRKKAAEAAGTIAAEETRRLVDDNTTDDVEGVAKVRPTVKRSPLLALPAICDLLGTTTMNIGLLYTPVSIYQMTRGSVILIVGLMSVIFLQKRITKLEWMSLVVVFLGVFFVGLSGYLQNNTPSGDDVVNVFGEVVESLDIIFGMVLIFMGITMTAVQFVVEEHILTHLKLEPMEIVGFEGVYGSIITSHIMFFGKALYGKGIFDMNESFYQMFHNETILYSSMIIMISICTFNFCGITLTFLLNATSRSTIDTSRTLLVWIISLAVGWESFHWLQLLAFGMLVTGTLSFNGVIQPETWKITPRWLKDLESEIHI